MSEQPEEAPSTSQLDAKVDGLAEKVDALIGALHGGSQRTVQARLDAPGNVAQQVQEELDRRDRRAKAEDTAAQVGSLSETVARLAEKAPETPVNWAGRLMGWGR
jgi:cell division septation protein DedD